MAVTPTRAQRAPGDSFNPKTGALQVSVSPLAKDLEQLSDDELDALLAEHDKMAAEVQGLSDEDLDTLLRAGEPPREGADPAKGVVVNPPQEPLSGGELVAGGARELLGGALFEFGDEAEAAARAPFSDKSFDELLRDIRRERARFGEQEPGAAVGLNVAGGILPMLIPGVGQLGKGVEALSGISKLSSPLARTAAMTGAQGSLAGVGSGETLGERFQNSLTGGVLGAGLGAGARGFGRGIQWGRDVARNVRGLNDEATAAATAADILAGRTNPADMRAQIDLQRKYGVPATVGTLNPELATLAENVVREPSPSRAALVDKLTKQHVGGGERVKQQVEMAFPGTPDYFEAEEKILGNLRRNADAGYGAAYAAAPEIRDPLIRQALDNPAIQSAYQDALRMSRDEMAAAALRGEDPAPYAMKEFMDPVLDAQGNLTGLRPSGTKIPDLRSLDTIKRALDARISSLYSSGQGGEATALKQLRDAFVDRLDKIGPPEYKAARGQYKGDIEVKEALELGRKTLTGNMRWQQVNKLVRDFTPGEKEAFKTGVLQQVMRRFEDTSASRNFAKELVDNDNIRNTLRAVVGPEEFKVLNAALRQEADLFGRGSKVLSGSQTFGRAAEKQAIEEKLGAGDATGVMDLVLNPTPGNIFRRTMQALTNMRNANVSRATYDQLAKMLAASSPRETQELLARLEATAPAREARERAFDTRTTRAGGAAARIVAGQPPEKEQPPTPEADPAARAEELMRALSFTIEAEPR